MGMRLAAQAKLGYYPVRPETLALVCSALRPEDPATTLVLDPCCGQGKAIEQIGTLLAVPKTNLYGVELDERRAEMAAEHCNVVHSSIFSTRVSVKTFSLAWVNPPYEDEIRQEDETSNQLEVSFVFCVARMVVKDGVFILHMPDDRITPQVIQAFHTVCYDAVKVILPGELRPWRESLLVGLKREGAEKNVMVTGIKTVTAMPAYTLPAGDPLTQFSKSCPTDEEIWSGMARAAFWKVFEPTRPRPRMRPVLPLGPGHLGLTLASGFLDGFFEPPGWEPHVLRGIAYKENQLAKEESTESAEGTVTETKTFRENIKLKIRAIDGAGTIREIK